VRSADIHRPGSCRCSTSGPSARPSGSVSRSVRGCWCNSPNSSRAGEGCALTFLGPLLGSLIRPFGGALADRFKGSAVTSFNFLAMAFGALVVLGASQINSLPLFIVGFVILFIFSGIGNGSTYKMIPAIFHAKAQLEVGAGLDLLEADHRAIRRAGALIGLAGAIGALGGVMVNLAFRQSFLTLQNGEGAYIAPSLPSTSCAAWSPGSSSCDSVPGCCWGPTRSTRVGCRRRAELRRRCAVSHPQR
jgi:nitrate/nitrite transporter NarK